MNELYSFDWPRVAGNALRLLIAFVLAFPRAWEREKTGRHLGLRTFRSSSPHWSPSAKR